MSIQNRGTKENQNSKQAQGLSINEEGNGSFLSSYTGSNSLKINQIYYSNQYLFEWIIMTRTPKILGNSKNLIKAVKSGKWTCWPYPEKQKTIQGLAALVKIKLLQAQAIVRTKLLQRWKGALT